MVARLAGVGVRVDGVLVARFVHQGLGFGVSGLRFRVRGFGVRV